MLKLKSEQKYYLIYINPLGTFTWKYQFRTGFRGSSLYLNIKSKLDFPSGYFIYQGRLLWIESDAVPWNQVFPILPPVVFNHVYIPPFFWEVGSSSHWENLGWMGVTGSKTIVWGISVRLIFSEKALVWPAISVACVVRGLHL